MEFKRFHNKLYQNVYISQVALGGKTADEATALLEKNYITPLLDKEITLCLKGNKSTFPLKHFFTNSNMKEVISDAQAYSNNLTLSQKLDLLMGKQNKQYNITLNFDDNAITQWLNDFISVFVTPPKDASINIDPSGNITLVSAQNGMDILHQKELVQKIYKELNELSITDSPIYIDLDAMLVETSPTISTAQLEQINKRVASYHTNINPTADNATNIALAAKTINGILIMPGDSFSFNDIVGDTTLAKGYISAPILVNGKVEDGIGGGVCQVSSTLYNAVLSVGILATQRAPHSRPSAYVPLGLDAAISWGSIDFKFVNTIDFPLYISCYTEGNRLYANIYSNEAVNHTTYKFKSEIYSTLPSTLKYISDSTLPSGARILSSSGNKGYKVKVTRETYTDNKLQKTEVISWDTYPAIPTIYRIGS